MSLLTREAILAASDLVTERVLVPEWGGEVLVRSLTGAERDAFEAASFITRGQTREVNLANLRARLLALALVDETGSALFVEADIVALGRKNARVLDRLFEIAQRLSGLGPKDIETLAKNSEPGPNGGSSSG